MDEFQSIIESLDLVEKSSHYGKFYRGSYLYSGDEQFVWVCFACCNVGVNPAKKNCECYEKAKWSACDKRGILFVDCIECQLGSKGDKSCASGAKCKKGGVGTCNSGVLLDHLTAAAVAGGAK